MIQRIVRVSLRNLARQPFRTLLILQGVIWGTALGVAPPAIIRGSREKIEEKAVSLGTDRILITQESVGGDQQFDWGLADRLAKLLGSDVRHIAALHVVEGREGSVRPTVIAIDERAFAARSQRLARGRLIARADVTEKHRVAVAEPRFSGGSIALETPIQLPDILGDAAVELVGVTEPRAAPDQLLDEMGYERDHPLRGLLEEMEETLGVFNSPHARALNSDESLLVPYTLVDGCRPNWLELRVDPQHVVAVRDRVQHWLRASGFEPVIYINAVVPILYGETIETVVELNRAVFVITVIVGTSVVCCIMMLSVVERQREIAIRRVEGARQWHVAVQFVIETGTLCSVGGVCGVPLGLGIAALRCWIDPHGAVTWSFPLPEVVVLLIVVTTVGLIGGLLPAWRAVRVDPVEMLRYE